MDLPSTKPYLLRALWEWCCDHGYTPHLAVVVDERTRVPREFVRDGQIVLNIGPEATHKLQMGNDLIEFQARFGGVARDLSVPVDQIAAIYARENGAGMAFEVGGDSAQYSAPATEVLDFPPAAPLPASPISGESPDDPRPDGGRPRLQRIK